MWHVSFFLMLFRFWADVACIFTPPGSASGVWLYATDSMVRLYICDRFLWLTLYFDSQTNFNKEVTSMLSSISDLVWRLHSFSFLRFALPHVSVVHLFVCNLSRSRMLSRFRYLSFIHRVLLEQVPPHEGEMLFVVAAVTCWPILRPVA